MSILEKLRLAVACCVASMTVGCVVLPINSGSKEPLYGKEIGSDKLDTLEIGKSTREDVIAYLSRPTIDFQEYRLLAYVWVLDTGRWLILSPYGSPTLEAAESQVVYLAFDEQDVLVAKAPGKAPGVFGSIMESARDWMATNGIEPPPRPTHPPWGNIPNGKGMIVVLRDGPAPGGALTYTAWDPTAIALDGQYRAELTNDTYIGLICEPGRHSVSADARPPYRNTSHISSVPSPRVSHSVNVPPGKVVFLRTQSGTGTGSIELVLEEVTREVGEEALKALQPAW